MKISPNLYPLQLTVMKQPWCPQTPHQNVHQSEPLSDRQHGRELPLTSNTALDGFLRRNKLTLSGHFFFFARVTSIILNQKLNSKVQLSESFTYIYVKHITIPPLMSMMGKATDPACTFSSSSNFSVSYSIFRSI